MLGDHLREPERRTATFGRRTSNSSPRLLVIDDVDVHRMVICRIGQRAGLLPSEAHDPATALALISEFEFDCATLDLSLGERAGTELLALFAQRKVRFPIIIISGSDTIVADDAFRLGNDLDLAMLAPITKPVDLTRLRETLIAITAEWQNSGQPDGCAAPT